MNLLFLHGLESKLSQEKRTILENYATVIAPDLNYKTIPNTIELLFKTYKKQNIDVIIGSSMGGFAGYYLANLLGVPCMLFNPALPYRHGVELIIPLQFPLNHSPSMRIILGGQDTVIKANDNLLFLSQNISNTTDLTIVLKHDLAHQIPLEVFKEQTQAFFE